MKFLINLFFRLLIVLILSLILINCIYFVTPASESLNVKDYIKQYNFPAIVQMYLKPLEELDQNEKEFLNLLEKVSLEKQEYFAQKVYEQGFTAGLLEELQSICPNISYGEQYHFRKREWGMTKEEIIETEKPKKNRKITITKKTDYDLLSYKGYIAGFSSYILYTIREGKLTNTQYTILDINEGRE